VEVHLHNTGQTPLKVGVSDKSYKGETVTKTIAAGAETSIVVPSSKSHGWYDFGVSADGLVASTRFAGRVETGASSFSDPAMGLAV